MKQKKFVCKAVFFDLWDTLVFSFGVMRKTQRIMGLQSLQFMDFVERYEKATMKKNFSSPSALFVSGFRAFGLKPKKQQLVVLEKLWKHNLKNAELFPESLRVLQSLKARGFKLVLVSNLQYFGSRALLKRLKLEHFFDSIQFSFEARLLKPDKRIFLRALKQLKLRPNQVVMVGDSLTDFFGAKNAMIRCVIVARKAKKENNYKALATINNLEELLDLLESEKNGSC
jgi:HAD superfamily hydrolase (TIGR01662 family)